MCLFLMCLSVLVLLFVVVVVVVFSLHNAAMSGEAG